MNGEGNKRVSDFKDTLNLPRTGFPMRANLPQREPERIRIWKEKRIYHKMLEKRKKGPLFILHDGPPYSNGHIHLGQALNKILKDFLVKYSALRGYFTPFIPGWDNHGMPIENEVIRSDPELSSLLKDMEALKRPEIKIKIREKCREFASKWVEIQKGEFVRLGVFADWENPYLTMAREYEAEELKIFADFVEMGYIYRGTMPIHWCPVCQTALAMAEIEYKEKRSPSLWFRFKAKEDKGIFNGEEGFALVWTTTPWTIISNVALAFHPDFTYAVIDVNGTLYLLAEELIEVNSEKLGFKNIKIVKKIRGEEIEGAVFHHPFYERDSRAILADFVTLETGTGIVHIAPGHGREDFEVGQKYGLPVISPVDERGKFTRESGPLFEGLSVDEASRKVVEVLKEEGNFLHFEEIVHSYPHCWRCKGPLIFRATSQWFLKVDHDNLRKRALEEIGRVRWHPPDSINRITASVAERPDWVLSRQRAWGVNIPAFYCLNCGYILLDPEIIRYVASIFEREGSDAWHRLSVSELLPENTQCPKCGGAEFEKEMDILDVWFDSGATSLIVLKKSKFLDWPSDVYLEGPDQHRGWFNAALMLGVAKRNRAPYRTVITHGWTLDEEGRAMHKSLGNVISPLEITDKYGADVLRLWVAQSDYTEDMRLGREILERTVESYRKIRNTFRFMLGNLYDFDPIKDYLKYDELYPVDRYILHRLEEIKEISTKSFENLEFHKMFHRAYQFAVVDLSSFYLDITKDRLYTWGKKSKGRRSAQTVIYECLRTLLILFSPIISFTTEEAWEHLPGEKEESVFLSRWPEPNPDHRDPKLALEFEHLLELREKVLLAIERARKENQILSDRLEAEVLIYPKEALLKELLEKNLPYLPELFIVSEVNLIKERAYTPVQVEDEKVFVGVKHAEGEKCARCWIWHRETGKNREYPGLCPKCVQVLRGDSNDN
jgi:isoleucyl-tRNA synthetase